MTSAWSRGLHLHWWPTPEFYDRRSRLLSMLDEQHGLERFRVDEDSVGAVLETAVEIVINVGSVSVYSYKRRDAETEADMFGAIVAAIAGELSAKPRSLVVYLQHLVPWQERDDAVAACADAATVALSSVADVLNPFDMAVLTDGKRPSEGTYQIEFGVVSADEAPARVSRLAGRAIGARPTQHDLIVSEPFPAVATFADSTWSVPFDDNWTGDLTEFVHTELLRADSEAEAVVSALHVRLAGVRESVGGES